MTLREAMKNYYKARRAYWKNDSKLKDCYVTMDDLGDFVDEHNQYVVFNPTFLDDDWEEYKEDILDEEEKKYLGNIVKPYRDRVRFIVKTESTGYERIIICLLGLTQQNTYIVLPYFYKNTMCKGMEVGKDYTLEELGL